MGATRQGSRWLHEPPTEEEVKDWFSNQHLHKGMDHGPYLGGIVLISATEKIKVTKTKQNGELYTQEGERAVYVPYVKVDTRIAYFWDLVRALNEEEDDREFIGVIEPVEQRRITDSNSAYYNENLPDGFSVLPIRNQDNSISRFLVASYRVAIYERESYARRIAGEQVPPILQGVGSKQTTLARKWADDNAVMKAETGAIGRALGVAGVLVVGTGVATAEDMQEAQAGNAGPAAAADEGPALPADVAPGGAVSAVEAPGAAEAAAPAPAVEPEQTPEEKDEALRARALELQAEMERDFPPVWEAYKAWWASRSFGPLSELTGPALVGAVTKLERDLDAAKNPPQG